MSERPNDQPNEDELEPTSPADALTDDVEAADDGDAADDAAMSGDFENDDPTIEAGDAALLAAAEVAPLASIAAIGAVEEAGAQTRPMRPSERRAMRAAMDHGQLVIDPAHRVSDRPSAIFVIVTVAAFVLILFNGLVLGHGGFLTPLPTPTPIPSVTASPVPSATAAPSGSVVPSASPIVSPTPAPTVTPPPPSATPGAS